MGRASVASVIRVMAVTTLAVWRGDEPHHSD